MQTEEREIELIDYIEVVFKRKWLILLGTLACVAGAVVYLLATASPVPLYTASAQIFVVSGQNQGKEVADTQTEIPSLTLDLYQAVAVSDDLVLAMNKLQQGWIDSLGLRVPGRLALEAKTEGNTRLVMRVSTTDTLLARLVLYAWVDTFMSRNQTLSATESERYYHYVVAQHKDAREHLERAEDSLLQFNLRTPITSLQNQQKTYLGHLQSAQDTLIVTQIRLEEKTAQLRQAREMVEAIEIDGEPLYVMPVTALPGLRPRLSSNLARQLLDNTLEVDSLKAGENKMETHYNLALLAFDQEHDYTRLQRTAQELTKITESYQRNYMQARSKEMASSTNLIALEEELKKHPITFGGPRGEGREASKKGEGQTSAGGELNPAYVTLEQKRAEEGLSYETARAYADKGLQQLKELESRLDEAQSQFYTVQAQRQTLVDGMEGMTRDLKRRIRANQASVDAVVQSYLDSKMAIGDLASQVALLENQLGDQQAQLARLDEKTRAAQDLLSRALTDSVRFGREKETYTATFVRFAQLSEEARIAQQKTNTNLRVLTRDVTAKPISAEEDSRKKVWISGAVGLLLSTFLAFLLEYMHKVRVQRATSS